MVYSSDALPYEEVPLWVRLPADNLALKPAATEWKTFQTLNAEKTQKAQEPNTQTLASRRWRWLQGVMRAGAAGAAGPGSAGAASSSARPVPAVKAAAPAARVPASPAPSRTSRDLLSGTPAGLAMCDFAGRTMQRGTRCMATRTASRQTVVRSSTASLMHMILSDDAGK